MKKYGFIVLLLLVIVLAILFFPKRIDHEPGDLDEAAFVEANVAHEPLKKIIFIGVDGADWQIINPLIEKGKLPNFKKIVESGASGPLRTIEPILSPLIWTTMATGKLPEEHGILNFTVGDPETGERIPITRLYRKVDAFWNMMSDYDRTVDVIGWLATFPAEEINGVMVTDRVGYLAFASFGDSHTPPPGAVSPPERFSEMTDLLVKREDVSVEEMQRFVHVDRQVIEESRGNAFDPENPINNLLLIYMTALSHRNMALHLLEKDHPDFLGVYYELLDAVCHLFIPYAPPRQSGINNEDFQKYKDAVDETYVLQDQIIGEMLEWCENNTVVMIASDHGFKSGNARYSTSAEIGEGHAAFWHRLDGIICLFGSGIRPGHRIENATVLDIAPTILALAGFPRVEDMPGRIIKEAFTPSLQQSLNPTVVATLERERAHEDLEEIPDKLANEAEMKRLEALGYITRDNPDALNNLGQRYQKRNEYEKAIVEYEKAIALRPNFSKALNNVGICYGKLERYPEAERSFLKAIELNPKDVFAMNNLAVMYLVTGNNERAVHFAEKAVTIEPKYTNAHVTLGSIYATMGKFELAEKEFRTALEVEPDNVSALENLKKVQTQKQGLE